MNREPVSMLLIEDSRTYAEAVQMWLADAPEARYQITHVVSLARALALLRENLYDIVLLDLILENGQGVVLVNKVREILDDDKPLVVFTSMEDEKVEEDAIKASASEFFFKRDLETGNEPRCLQRIIRVARARHWSARFCEARNKPAKELAESIQNAVNGLS